MKSWVTSLKVWVLQFDLPPAQTALCGVEAPVWPIGLDMIRRRRCGALGLCVACLQACPDPARLAWIRDTQLLGLRDPVPTDVLQEIAPAVETS